MKEIKPCVGMAAISKQGHDKGRAYVITDIIDESFVYAADGDIRKLDKQKKKRIKHLRLTSTVFPEIEAKLLKTDKRKLYDTEIKRALSGMAALVKSDKQAVMEINNDKDGHKGKQAKQ